MLTKEQQFTGERMNLPPGWVALSKDSPHLPALRTAIMVKPQDWMGRPILIATQPSRHEKNQAPFNHRFRNLELDVTPELFPRINAWFDPESNDGSVMLAIYWPDAPMIEIPE
jgi:hypothetical protein